MLSVTVLPHLNAILNGIAACLLIGGFFFIKSGNRFAHRWCMVAALTVSGLFLISYVTLRFYTPIFVFQGVGVIRIFYYFLLISHILLAIAIVPLVLFTVFHAFKDRFAAHKKIARWTWLVWMYVSVSGILVYMMLYRLYPLKTAQVM